MRDSPRDGLTLDVIATGQEVEVLGRETWLRVRHGSQTGFVLADYVEPVPQPTATAAPVDEIVRITQVHHEVLRGEPLRIDVAFEDAVTEVLKLAQFLRITLWITSSLREPYAPVTNTIVSPAKFSNHHVGHGFDMNVIFDGQHFRGQQLGQPSSLPPVVQGFLSRVAGGLRFGLRWGGSFVPADPVHIDDGLNVRNQPLFDRKLRALWGPPPQS